VWDPLSFEVYLGGEGVTEIALTDDHRQLHFTMTVERGHLGLDGGPLEYVAGVRVHQPAGPPVEGRLGQPINLS
jgi:hypothetical protein